MKNLFLGAALAVAFLTTSAKAETINCTEITSVPTIITVQGVYCLKRDQSSALASGNIIDIQTNNVTIDLNGFKLGGLGGGLGTNAIGIFASDRQNITIRNGSVRGFLDGIFLLGSTSSGHLVEDLLLDQNREVGVDVQGTGHVVRNNRIVNTGGGSNRTSAVGISLQSARNVVVADNIISGTSETLTAEGIFVNSGALVVVRGNIVLDTKDATTTRGIDIINTTDVTVIGNRVLNAGGSNGIADLSNSSGVNCIDNSVAGFTIAISGCDFLAGNNTP